MKRQDDQKLIDEFYAIMKEETAVYRMTPEEQADWILKEAQIYTKETLVNSFAKRYDELNRLIAKRIRSLCLDMMLQISAHTTLGGDYIGEEQYRDHTADR